MAVLDYPERLIYRWGFLCSRREEIDWRLSPASAQLSGSSRGWPSAPAMQRVMTRASRFYRSQLLSNPLSRPMWQLPQSCYEHHLPCTRFSSSSDFLRDPVQPLSAMRYSQLGKFVDHQRAAATYALRSRQRIPYLRTDRQEPVPIGISPAT